MKKFVVTLVLFISGCSQLPISTEFQSSLISKVGGSLLNSSATPRYEIPEQPIKDKKIRSYVKALGNKLTTVASLKDTDLYFDVLASPIIQGMAAYVDSEIYVTTGMLNTINNEAEVAALIGHEIGHIALGHADSEFSDRGEILDTIADNAENHFGLNLGLSAHRFDISFSQYKKEKEEKADEFGVILASKAGYNPYALCDLFDRLSANVKTGILQKIGNLKGSHKSLSDRAEHLRKFLTQKGYTQNRDGFFSYRYQKALRSLLPDEKQSTFTGDQQKVLAEVRAYQKEVDRHQKLRRNLDAERFRQIMSRVSQIQRQYQLSIEQIMGGESSCGVQSFMAEKLVERTPLWGAFKPRLSAELSHLLNILAHIGVGFIPVVGTATNLYELLTGVDFLTGEDLSPTERGLTAVGLLVGQGKLLRGFVSGALRTAHRLGADREVKDAFNYANRYLETSRKLPAQPMSRADSMRSIPTKSGSSTGSNAVRNLTPEGSTGKVGGFEAQELAKVDKHLEIARELRRGYSKEVASLKDEVVKLLSSGKSKEEVARKVSQMRREIGIKYKNKTPDELKEFIYTRNGREYKDPLGPSVEQLVEKYKSRGLEGEKLWDKIIEVSSTSNNKIDKLLE